MSRRRKAAALFCSPASVVSVAIATGLPRPLARQKVFVLTRVNVRSRHFRESLTGRAPADSPIEILC
jgi:hypothetical protein